MTPIEIPSEQFRPTSLACANRRVARAGTVSLALLAVLTAGSSPAQTQDHGSLTPADYWERYLRRTYAPTRVGLLAVETAIDHAFRDPACWDSTASSYGRRVGLAFERRVTRNTLELAGGLLTGEDLRYHASLSSSFQARIWNALRSSVTARMPNGRTRPAYTRFFASEVTELTTARWTGHSISAERMGRSLGWCAFNQMQTNLLDEFGPDLRRAGLRLYRRALGK